MRRHARPAESIALGGLPAFARVVIPDGVRFLPLVVGLLSAVVVGVGLPQGPGLTEACFWHRPCLDEARSWTASANEGHFAVEMVVSRY